VSIAEKQTAARRCRYNLFPAGAIFAPKGTIFALKGIIFALAEFKKPVNLLPVTEGALEIRV
jgi:hypothetical protein